jgi:hypothetical protein
VGQRGILFAIKTFILQKKNWKIGRIHLVTVDNLELNHYVFQDNYYNSEKAALTILDKKTRVCSATDQQWDSS